MLAWPDQGRPAAALSLPFAAPVLMSKSDVVGAGKTAMILVFEGVCGAEMKETQSSGRIHMLSCLATQREQSLGSHNQKMASFPRAKALQTSLSASPAPTWFSCVGQRWGYRKSHKVFLKLLQFYFDNTCGSTHCFWSEEKKKEPNWVNKPWCWLDHTPSAAGTQYWVPCSWTQQTAYCSDLKVISGFLSGRVS